MTLGLPALSNKAQPIDFELPGHWIYENFLNVFRFRSGGAAEAEFLSFVKIDRRGDNSFDESDLRIFDKWTSQLLLRREVPWE